MKYANATATTARTMGTVRRAAGTPDLMTLFAESQATSLAEFQEAIREHMEDIERKQLVGRRLRELRDRSPYTQAAIADAIGVQLRAVQKMEQTGGISYSNKQKLAELFDVDVSYFFPNDAGEPAANDQIERIESMLRANNTLLLEIVTRLDAVAPPLTEAQLRGFYELAQDDADQLSAVDRRVAAAALISKRKKRGAS